MSIKKSKGRKISKKIRLMIAGGMLSLVVLIAGVFIYSRWVSAGSAILYPDTCLGSWQNPDKAQGRPDTNDAGLINKDNAAIFSEGGIKEIYCGSFNGDLSESEIKLIKSVTLKFSWLVSDEELKTATSSITIIQPPATSSEAVASNTDYIVNQILNNINADEVQLIISTTTPEITITTDNTQQATDNTQQATSSISEIGTTENTAAIAPISETIPATASSVSEINETQVATSSPTSFWWKKYNFFFADDTVSNVQQETASTNSGQATTATSSLDSLLSPTEDFLKVSYTIDGTNWQELGKINKTNWQNLSFEIPVYQLEDVKKIQIKIESLPLVNKTPYVYLDGMALEVEYESGTLTQDESSASSALSTKPLKVRNLQKNIVLDEKATHSCRAEPFRLDISGKSYLTTTLILQNSGEQEPEEIEIGSLPIGIDITFLKNKDYLYLPAAGETALDLEITSEPGSQKGSFGIPIIYTEKGASDSTTICQINVVNF